MITLSKRYKKIIRFMFILILFCISSTCTYGAVKVDRMEFIPKNMQNAANGAEVKLNSDKSNLNELNISMSTKGLGSGYYTSYLYENENRDWINYAGIAFDVENESSYTAIRINLDIKESDGTIVSPSDNDIVLIRKNDTEIMDIVHPSNGTIEIPTKFKGTIYMPFNSFKEKDKVNLSNTKTISKISSWGIVATLPENEEANFVLSKFSLINKGTDIEKYFNWNFYIEGDKLVQIPVVGEAISDYKIKSNSKELNSSNVKFQLIEPVEGISLNESGRLILKTPDIEPQKIQICAIFDGSVSETMDIQLAKSWTLGTKEADGTNMSIPKAGEVSQIISDNNIFMSKNVLTGVRAAVLLIAMGFGSLYLSWKKQKK